MKRKKRLLDDTNIEAMGGVSVETAIESAILRQAPAVQKAIREEAAKTNRPLGLVLADWMEAGKAA
jgi:hypothetical protein